MFVIIMQDILSGVSVLYYDGRNR